MTHLASLHMGWPRLQTAVKVVDEWLKDCAAYQAAIHPEQYPNAYPIYLHISLTVTAWHI